MKIKRGDKMRNDYYVYVYVRLDNNSIFYVGKGTGIRMYRTEPYIRGRHFINILNKVPCVVYKLYDNLTEEESLFLEQETIEDLVFNEGYGIDIKDYTSEEYNLVNNTWGGEGISGYKHSPEEIAKSTHFGTDNGMYGKKGELSPHYNVPKTEEHKNKIMMSNPRRKKVKCLELDRVFNSYREASRILLEEYNIKCSHASISCNCRGKSKCCGTYLETNTPIYLHFENISFANND